MNFKEFFLLSESLSPTDLKKAWYDQPFLKRTLRNLSGRANYPKAQKANLSLPGRGFTNMVHYLDELIGADYWNKEGISYLLHQIKSSGGDMEAVKKDLYDLMLKIARGDYSPDQAADIVSHSLKTHLANSERKQSFSKPSLSQEPMPRLAKLPK